MVASPMQTEMNSAPHPLGNEDGPRLISSHFRQLRFSSFSEHPGRRFRRAVEVEAAGG